MMAGGGSEVLEASPTTLFLNRSVAPLAMRGILVLLALALTSGCLGPSPAVEENDPSCPAPTAPPAASGAHSIHLRLWVRGGEATCVHVRLDDTRIVSGVVEPSSTRLQPFIPPSFGTFSWDVPSATLRVDAPERALEEARTLALAGELWVVVEVDAERIVIETYEEDPYRDAD